MWWLFLSLKWAEFGLMSLIPLFGVVMSRCRDESAVLVAGIAFCRN